MIVSAISHYTNFQRKANNQNTNMSMHQMPKSDTVSFSATINGKAPMPIDLNSFSKSAKKRLEKIIEAGIASLLSKINGGLPISNEELSNYMELASQILPSTVARVMKNSEISQRVPDKLLDTIAQNMAIHPELKKADTLKFLEANNRHNIFDNLIDYVKKNAIEDAPN